MMTTAAVPPRILIVASSSLKSFSMTVSTKRSSRWLRVGL